MENNLYKVFVYGTLKKDKKNHSLLKDSRFLGEAQTGREFSLYFNDHPCLVFEESANGVSGEIYEVDDSTLADLDELEEHPTWYERQEHWVEQKGEKVKVWLYVFPKDLLKPSAIPIANGFYQGSPLNN